jgi:hypothetical protein
MEEQLRTRLEIGRLSPLSHASRSRHPT